MHKAHNCQEGGGDVHVVANVTKHQNRRWSTADGGGKPDQQLPCPTGPEDPLEKDKGKPKRKQY